MVVAPACVVRGDRPVQQAQLRHLNSPVSIGTSCDKRRLHSATRTVQLGRTGRDYLDSLDLLTRT